ncbi:hypothetical protein [Mariniflexile sp. HMF6888]|uniref:hypothetical protein n=1 Tax=Mariniflexile sp. HMF6888 TaxID=3373086 RepID=UPI003798D3BE
MSTIDKIEFDDFKKVRKSLLIFSLTGIIFKTLINNSTGDFELFGLSFDKNNQDIIPNLLFFTIIFLLIAFIIRGYNEHFKEYLIRKTKSYLTDFSKINGEIIKITNGGKSEKEIKEEINKILDESSDIIQANDNFYFNNPTRLYQIKLKSVIKKLNRISTFHKSTESIFNLFLIILDILFPIIFAIISLLVIKNYILI